FGTISMIYGWGRYYLDTSKDMNEFYERLKKPIAIRHISNPIGGKIEGRSDFSQNGSHISFHLIREVSLIIDGYDSGKFYGDINHEAQEYSKEELDQLSLLLLEANPAIRIRIPETSFLNE
ncbi:MAG TPA: hypothetical protein VK469_20140, partial [Candidatus Kapabacteria bacterium]|nr:hypothetical protein [Candidatus Kapabacteria bacterium]